MDRERLRNRRFLTRSSLVLVATLLSAAAAAQTGVSDDRVSLPEGPGSLEGIGDDVSVNPNMGAARPRTEWQRQRQRRAGEQ